MESAKNVEHTTESFYLLGFYEDKFHFAGLLWYKLKLCTHTNKDTHNTTQHNTTREREIHIERHWISSRTKTKSVHWFKQTYTRAHSFQMVMFGCLRLSDNKMVLVDGILQTTKFAPLFVLFTRNKIVYIVDSHSNSYSQSCIRWVYCCIVRAVCVCLCFYCGW